MIYYSASETAGIIDQVDALQDVADAAGEVGDKITHFDMSKFLPVLLNAGVKLLVLLLIWFIGKKITSIVVHLFEKTATYNNMDVSITKFVMILIRWLMYFLIVCTMLNYLDIGTTSLVAVMGSAGLAIGLALQGSLTNFAGSVVLLFMKPFGIGDYIVTPQGEGNVKLIGLIYTTLVTIDNKEIHIPNGALANSNITNVSACPTRVASVKVGISYQADLKKAKALMEELIRGCEYFYPGSEPKIFVSDLGDSAVHLEGRCTVEAANYWPATWYLTEEIKLLYDREGIEIPFNQVDVHMK